LLLCTNLLGGLGGNGSYWRDALGIQPGQISLHKPLSLKGLHDSDRILDAGYCHLSDFAFQAGNNKSVGIGQLLSFALDQIDVPLVDTIVGAA